MELSAPLLLDPVAELTLNPCSDPQPTSSDFGSSKDEQRVDKISAKDTADTEANELAAQSYGQRVSSNNDDKCRATQAKVAAEHARAEAEHLKLLHAFREQYGENADSKVILRAMKRTRAVHKDDFWLCFSVTYPLAAFHLAELFNHMLKISRIFNPYSDGPRRWLWAASWRPPFANLLRVGPSHSNWGNTTETIRGVFPMIEKAWVASQAEISQMEETLETIENIRQSMDAALTFLQTQQSAIAAADEAYKIEQERKASIENAHYLQDPKLGLTKVRSWSTAIDEDIPLQHISRRHQSLQKPSYAYNGPTRSRGFLQHSWGRSNRGSYAPLKVPLKELKDMSLPEAIGHRVAVYFTVLLFGVAGAVTSALAIWQCSTPSTIPTIDSNFWSTLSQATIGLAGLYCIIIPLLRNGKIPVKQPRLFNFFIITSMITALISVVTYPFQSRVSLVLAYISGAAQLAATLQLIEGADSTITNLNLEGEFAHREIDRLEDELSFARAGNPQ